MYHRRGTHRREIAERTLLPVPGAAACTISFGANVVWSIVWPARWFVYLKGLAQ
jgi:hypothetical protein